MATSAPRLTGARAAGRVARAVGWIDALYALGAVMLGVEAAVHVQQFVSLFHAVRWIGPLFLANAAASLLAAAGLAHHRTRPVAAFGGNRVVSVRARQPRAELRNRALRLDGRRLAYSDRACARVGARCGADARGGARGGGTASGRASPATCAKRQCAPRGCAGSGFRGPRADERGRRVWQQGGN